MKITRIVLFYLSFAKRSSIFQCIRQFVTVTTRRDDFLNFKKILIHATKNILQCFGKIEASKTTDDKKDEQHQKRIFGIPFLALNEFKFSQHICNGILFVIISTLPDMLRKGSKFQRYSHQSHRAQNQFDVGMLDTFQIPVVPQRKM